MSDTIKTQVQYARLFLHSHTMKFAHLLLCSVFTFFVLYGPQPILPELAKSYALNSAQAGLLMTATMLPLAIAPLVYGVFLMRVAPLALLQGSFLLLALSCALFPLASSFSELLLLRTVQGAILPACLTAMTSYIGGVYKYNFLSKAITTYVFSTIAGGFLARISSAAINEYWSWQLYFYVLAAILLLLAISLHGKKARRRKAAKVANEHLFAHIGSLFSNQKWLLYCAVFCMFFCFTALLNYLPFILGNEFNFSSKEIGLAYSGYLIGAFASLLTPKLQQLSGGRVNLLVSCFTLYSATILALNSTWFWLFFIAFTLFCGAMFVIHANASAQINAVSKAPPSLTNGMYVSFYYCGGSAGSFLPGLIYNQFGKVAFLLSLLCVCITGLLLIVGYRKLSN